MTHPDPRDQGELATLLADLRRARQHHHAERERLEEMQRDFHEALRRAAEVAARRRG